MKRVVPLFAVAVLAFVGCKKKEQAKPAAAEGPGVSAAGPRRDLPPPSVRKQRPQRDVPEGDPERLRSDRKSDGPGGGRRMEQFDANGDGQLSDEERAALQADRDARRAERAARTAEFDKDGDGDLSDAERDTMRSARLDDMMAELDLDADGKLTAEEIGNATGRIQRMLDLSADADGDGTVTRPELDAAMSKRPPNLGRGGNGGWRDRRGSPQGELPGSGTPNTP